jgi:tetratricopeptide (TPR) repeat protein
MGAAGGTAAPFGPVYGPHPRPRSGPAPGVCHTNRLSMGPTAKRGVGCAAAHPRCARATRPGTGRAWWAAFALAWVLVAPAWGAGTLPAPLDASFVAHKRQILALEAALRTTPDAALSGVPGFPVLLLACEGTGCVGSPKVRVAGARTGTSLDATLSDAFAAGGWVPLSVVGDPGGATKVAWWGVGDGAREGIAPLPAAGRITVVTSNADGLAVAADVAPTAEHAWRVALAERGRGDPLAAIAALEAGVRLLPGVRITHRLFLADLYREAGLLDEADKVYALVASGATGDDAMRGTIGRARVALARGDADGAAALLAPLAPGPDHTLAGTVGELVLRAHLARERGAGIMRPPPATGGDPFALVNRALAFMAMGDTFSAVGEFRAAARAASRSVPEEAYLRERVLLALGTLYAQQGRLDEALGAFGEMSPEGPLADRLQFGRGLAFYVHGDLVKAVAEFQALEKAHPESGYAMEGILMMADAYRRLNAPRRAVAEYRRALERFQDRARAMDLLLADADRVPFDEGITGLVFGGRWRGGKALPDAVTTPGLRLLFQAPGFVTLEDDYRQIGRTIDRLEGVALRLERGGQEGMGRAVRDGIDRVGVFRSMFEAAARQSVIRVLKDERARLEDLSLTASLGVGQSMLFDRMAGDEPLYFRERVP